MAENQLKLVLKKDWDYPPHYAKQQGHFVGRESEKDKVLNWFIRREQGCFLLSGERGAGKTALVYEALREAHERNKKIVPILITATQLFGGISVKGEELPDEDFNKLKEEIIVNLVRRLYAELKDKIRKSDERYRLLDTLYRQAISSKHEIKDELRLKKGIEKIEEIEKSEEIKTEIDPNHLKFVIASILAVAGANIIYLPAFWGIQAINNILASILMVAPISVYIYIKRKAIERKVQKQAFSTEELYICDRNLSNLTHDLQTLLDKLADSWRIVVVIDEMDKMDSQTNEEKIVKAFKNLFTLSKGIFVFITGDKTFKHVESSRQGKGISYTLYNDRLFVSRPNFADLERYLDEIIENTKNKELENKQYHIFRNLLCYDSKSDFFELQYKIRDYIGAHDNQNRPILELPLFTKDELLKANLQKIIGQIFELNRFANPSQWHLNNDLLDSLYNLVSSPELRKEVVRYEKAKPHLNTLQSRMVKASENLVAYLSRLGYIPKSPKENIETANTMISVGFSFSWTGEVKDVFERPNIYLDYEKVFLQTFHKFTRMVNEIADLECGLKNQQIDVQISGENLSRNNIKPLCDLDVSSIYQSKLPFRDKLRTDMPMHVPREELDAQTAELNTHIKQLYSQTATLVMRLIKNNIQFKHFTAPKRFEHDGQLFGGAMNAIRNGIITTHKLVHDCIYKPSYSDQILIVQDMPNSFYDENKGLINSNAVHHLIINLDTTGQEYNLEWNVNRERKIKGFITIPVHQSFTNLKEVFKQVRECDKDGALQDEPLPSLNQKNKDKDESAEPITA